MAAASDAAGDNSPAVGDRGAYDDDSPSDAGSEPFHPRDATGARAASSLGLNGHLAQPGLNGFVEDGSNRALDLFSRLTGLFHPHGFSRVSASDADVQEDETQIARRKAFIPSLRSMITSSWVNWLLFFIPIGTVSYLVKISPVLTFVTNLIAIIPLSAMLTEATERIAAESGDTIGAMINISLGNLVELILFVALLNNQMRVVQASILGSILVNLLPILGTALLASSVVDQEPLYNTNEAQLLANLLFVSVFVFLIPTAFDYTFDQRKGTHAVIVKMSRMSAIMVFLIYVLYFAHEMRSRKPSQTDSSDGSDIELGERTPPEHELPVRNTVSQSMHSRNVRFADESGDPEAANKEFCAEAEYQPAAEHASASRPRAYHSQAHAHSRTHSRTRSLSLTSLPGSANGDSRPWPRPGLTALQMLHDGTGANQPYKEMQAQGRHRGERAASIVMLVLTSALMSMCAEFLVSTIDDITRNNSLSESVIGLIIIPIVGNLSEYVTVVSVAIRNKLDLAIAVAVGSSIQVAIGVMPLTVMAGWILHRDFALTFSVFEMAALLGTVLLVNLLVLNEASSNLRTRGLKGALMCACYVIIGFGAYLSPDEES